MELNGVMINKPAEAANGGTSVAHPSNGASRTSLFEEHLGNAMGGDHFAVHQKSAPKTHSRSRHNGPPQEPESQNGSGAVQQSHNDAAPQPSPQSVQVNSKPDDRSADSPKENSSSQPA